MKKKGNTVLVEITRRFHGYKSGDILEVDVSDAFWQSQIAAGNAVSSEYVPAPVVYDPEPVIESLEDADADTEDETEYDPED